MVQQYHIACDKRLIVFCCYLVYPFFLVLLRLAAIKLVVAYTLERLQSIEFLDLGIVLYTLTTGRAKSVISISFSY